MEEYDYDVSKLIAYVHVVSLSTVVLSIQVNEKSFDLKEGI